MNRKKIDTYIYGNVYPQWVILLVDSFIVVASFVFAFVARNGVESQLESVAIMNGVTFTLSINVLCFLLFRIPSRVLRYSSLFDLLRLAFTQTFSYFILSVLNTLFDVHLIHSGIIPIVYVMSTVLLISLRIIVKTSFEFRNIGQRDTIRVMIYVSESKSVDMVRRLRGDHTTRYRIKGFITDNLKMSGRYLMAIPVFVNDDKLLNVIDDRVIDAIVVDTVKMNFIKNSELIDQLLHRKIKLITLSPVEELKKEKENDQGSLARNVLIEDLLSKEPIQEDSIDKVPLFKSKRIMVTGAAGSIGRELVKKLSAFHPELFILIDQAETPLHDLRLMLKDDFGELTAHTIVADVTNCSRMESLFRMYRPHYIFHFAAYKHIPLLENDISEAVQVNIMGTCIIADLAIKYKADHFILASTDKAAFPNTIMGASKRIAEKYVLALAESQMIKENSQTKIKVIRFGNILDSNGSVLLRFKEQIAKKENLVVTHRDVVRRFLTVHEVAYLVIETCQMAGHKAIYTFDAGHPVKILDLAKRMIRLSGYVPEKDIKIEYSGLRPGEKLSETEPVLQSYESTSHDKIFIVPEVSDEYDLINSQVRHLFDASYEGDFSKIVSGLKEIIPGFNMK